MGRIDEKFKILKDREKVALIPFIVAGDPDFETTEALILKMAEAGADMIEIGVPFSDPISDGPIIQTASKRALQRDVKLVDVLHLTERLRKIDIPVILMTYYNPILKFGLMDFAKGCRDSRVDGVIIPDLPPEEAGPWISEARKTDLDTIFLLAPKSSKERIRKVSGMSRGFIYYVSVEGVTGMRERLPFELEGDVKRIKSFTNKPLCVGFGISTPEQAKEISLFADGVIIGSAIVKIIQDNINSPDMIARVGNFVSSFTRALRL